MAVPAKIAPFTLEGAHLIVSAFKRAEDGRGEIVRFWSAAEAEQRVTLRAGFSDARLTRVDLREQTVPTESNGQGTLVLRVRPFEIVTVRMERMRTD